MAPARIWRFAAALSLICICAVSLGASSAAPAGLRDGPPIHQLRIYEIFDTNKQAFHDRFRDHAARIMAKYDFRILAMWESKSEGRTEFVYLLQWPDEKTMKDRWARFMADAEWAEIKKKTAAEHGALVGSIQDRMLRMTDYSPTTLIR
jgi:hypothetical protein